MTPQESSMLQDLVGKVQGTPLTEKDPEAEELLQQTLDEEKAADEKLTSLAEGGINRSEIGRAHV